MVERIEILQRTVDDWKELYINGELRYEGDEFDIVENDEALAIIKWLDGKLCHVEVRIYAPNFKYDEKTNKEYDAPLNVITNKNYWEDWDKAEKIYPPD